MHPPLPHRLHRCCLYSHLQTLRIRPLWPRPGRSLRCSIRRQCFGSARRRTILLWRGISRSAVVSSCKKKMIPDGCGGMDCSGATQGRGLTGRKRRIICAHYLQSPNGFNKSRIRVHAAAAAKHCITSDCASCTGVCITGQRSCSRPGERRVVCIYGGLRHCK